MDHICTWLCADEVGEESIYPQTGEKSSGKKHQQIYWRCVLLFYATSRRFNRSQKHLLFTNVKLLPIVDEISVQVMLKDMNVEVIHTDFKYKTPKGYFNLFQNQFYEFSILEYIIQHNNNQEDQYLILDSDCIFTKSVADLFEEAKPAGFISFEDACTTELVIHGLSRINMKHLYEDLSGASVNEIPGYHLGEFFLANVKNIRLIFKGFKELWPELMRRHEAGLPKFNEEAQTLSYLYYKNGFKSSTKTHYLKRIWTNPVFYRNVETSDTEVSIWHLPAEKTFGLARLYAKLIIEPADYGFYLSHDIFINTVKTTLGIPYLPLSMKMEYYILSYYRALRKRIKKIRLIPKAAL
ncbi:hypothetical protein [Pedobacter heparinus]|uniref:hypothetical protein n=1 Tax=Pedobacter heparinus TaxID=984 RepID=UPI00292D3700|nr:hypothetical protein [Pedobacter heparinus]